MKFETYNRTSRKLLRHYTKKNTQSYTIKCKIGCGIYMSLNRQVLLQRGRDWYYNKNTVQLNIRIDTKNQIIQYKQGFTLLFHIGLLCPILFQFVFHRTNTIQIIYICIAQFLHYGNRQLFISFHKRQKHFNNSIII